MLDEIKKSPLLARVVPFAVFLLITVALQTSGGETSRYWWYLAKTVVGAWLVWECRNVVAEMKWAFSWEAVAVGVAVFVMWVGLDPFYPKQDELMFKLGFGKDPAETPPVIWNPFAAYGAGSAMGWFFVVVRTVGSTALVPMLEEVFYRSFLYRYLISPEFERVPLNRFHGVSLAVTCGVFAFTHHQWLAGILCGIAYQGLVLRKNRIGDAMTAHAITNFLLAVWVVARPDWKFW
ncbi:MAG: CAAX prenyl protease-related protein [Limisphaerales bacterium]